MSVSTTLVKTAAQALLALTQQATAVVTLGSAVDVSTKLGSAVVFGKMGRTAATALTNLTKFRLEGSAKTSGNDEWYPIWEWTSLNGTTAANSTTLNGATSAGATSFVVTSATGIAAGSVLYLRETGTPANSEWCRVASVSGTTVTPEEALTRAHTNSIAVTTLGEIFSALPVDLSGHVRVRVVVDTSSAASGTTIDVIFWLVTVDSATSA